MTNSTIAADGNGLRYDETPKEIETIFTSEC